MAGKADPYYDKNKPVKMCLRAGDAVLMDTRLMHCGGSNASQTDRALLHFSFETHPSQHAVDAVDAGAASQQCSRPFGFTYHILPSLQGTKCMQDFL